MASVERDNAITYFAETNFRGERKRFGIRQADRLRHVYVLGKTGVGKSTLLETFMADDLRAGRGFALVDPHGDLAASVERIGAETGRELLILDRARHRFLAYNPLRASRSAEERFLTASRLVAALRHIWEPDGFWGPNMEDILRYGLMTLAEIPGTHIGDLIRLLTDRAARRRAVARVSDPTVRDFWAQRFDKLPASFRDQRNQAVLNKIGAFVASPVGRRIIGNRRESVDLRTVIDEGRILVLNLSKGQLGEDVARLLGAIFVSGLLSAALSRADIPEPERRPFFLYLDEAQTVTSLAVAEILQEARKYGLGMVLAHQYLGQMREEVQDALLANAGTIIAFQVGGKDAERLAQEFAPDVKASDFLCLGTGEIYLKLSIGGRTSRPFSAVTATPERVLET